MFIPRKEALKTDWRKKTRTRPINTATENIRICNLYLKRKSFGKD